jgi:O-antigen/teichoic acid export membrane protein
MGMSAQIMRNILSNWGTFAISAVIQFMMMPFLVRNLGDTQYGIWVLILSFTGFLGLFDFGVSGSVVKYVAEFKAKKDDEELNRMCSSAFYIYVAAGIVVFLVAVIMALKFVQNFKIPAGDLTSAQWVTVIIGLQIGLSLPLGFFTGFMRGMQRYDHVAVISLAIMIVRTVLIFVLIFMGYKIIALAITHLLSTLAAGAIRAAYVFRGNRRLRLSLGFINRDTLAMVGRYSILLFVYYLASRLIFSVGNLIIGYYLAAAFITIYAIPHRLVDELRVVIFSTGVFQPAVSHLNAQGREDTVQRVLVNGTKYSMMVILPIAAAYIAIGDIFISLWIGPRYAQAGYPVLVILTLAVTANVTQYASTQTLQGIAKHGSLAYISIGEAAVNLVLSIILVRRHGIIGAAIGTLVPMVIANLVFIPWYTCRQVNLSIARFFIRGILVPLVPAIIFGILLYIGSRTFNINSWIRFVATLGACLGFYSLCSWRMCLSRQERIDRWRDLTSSVRSVVPFFRAVPVPSHPRVEKSTPSPD